MKYLKLSVLFFGFSWLLSACVTFAYNSPGISYICSDLNKNDMMTTNILTKNNFTERQTYDNSSSITALTNPCYDCEIYTKLFKTNGDSFRPLITTMGYSGPISNTVVGTSTVSDPGDYYIEYKRNDFTLLTTHHCGTWHIDF